MIFSLNLHCRDYDKFLIRMSGDYKDEKVSSPRELPIRILYGFLFWILSAAADEFML